MYRYRYGTHNPRRYDWSSRYSRNRYNRYSRRYPWYGNARWRPRASDRDRYFWVGLNDYNDYRYPIHTPTEEVEDNKPEIPPVEVAKKLSVKEIDLHIDENAKAHHTDDYECNEKRRRDGEYMKPELVIRRGEEFKMTITFDRPYSVKKNDIRLTFNMGDDYKPNKNLSATFKVKEPGESADYKPKRWGARVTGQSGHSLTISIFPPATIPIGEWEFSVTTVVEAANGKPIIIQYNHNEDINIIFNPWCKEDWVYLDDDEWRNETVLNDEGALYRGSHSRIGAKPWYFGQFDDGVLDAAFHLVRKSFGFRAAPGMANAAKVARNISQLVNSPNDDGVLVGNWSRDYDGGTKPTKWTGSVKILLEYMKTKKPVKFGQCWVFSGVVTTVCRALGMPCRSITNFSSAHNTDKDNLTIDYFWNGSEFEAQGDSVWNFHVWNEAWMSRPDLDDSDKWHGWQVIDATPQELSDGVYCCGPAPVKAIKEGEVNVGKDGDFIFAEVNADRVHREWSETKQKFVVKKRLKSAVGKNITTHQPTGVGFRSSTSKGHMERFLVTDEYKYKEGSDQERKIFKKAARIVKMGNSGNDDISDSEDEEFDEPIEIKIDDPGDLFVGDTFAFVVHVKNRKQSPTAVKAVKLKVYYTTYTDSGATVALTKEDKNLNLDPGKVHTMQIDMDEKTTTARPNDGFNFHLVAIATFHDSDHCVTEDFIFRLRQPDVIVQGPKTAKRFETVEIEASFKNPLSVYLTHCEIELDGGFTWEDPRTPSFKIRDLRPGETWRQTLKVCPKPFPRKKKDRELHVGFDSRQLPEIYGFHILEIVK